MGQPVTGHQIGQSLCDALDLPKNTVSFTLRVAVDQVVTVECEYYPSDSNAITRALAEFELVRKPITGLYDRIFADAEADLASELGFDEWMRRRTERAHAEYMARHAAGGIDYSQPKQVRQAIPSSTMQVIGRINGAPCKEVLDGVETRKSINAYKLWLQGAGHKPCDHEYHQDRFGPDGQFICLYCRDIKLQRHVNGKAPNA